MDWFSKLTDKVLDWIKLSPKYLFPVSLATGFLLFAKSEYLAALGLTELRSKYLPWIGGVFLLSTALFLSHVVTAFFSWLREKINLYFVVRYGRKKLHNLTNDERRILRDYIGRGTKTQNLSVEDGVVSELESENIIYQSSNIGRLVSGFAYNIQPWAWEYLNKNPELLFSKSELKALKEHKDNS